MRSALANSHHQYATRLRSLLPGSGRWLDLGCGHEHLPAWMGPPPDWLASGSCAAIGVDPDLEALRCRRGARRVVAAVGEKLPFRDGSFDLVSANMVLEHIQFPHVVFGEIARVLAPSGLFLFHTPNSLGYGTLANRLLPRTLRVRLAGRLQGRAEEDVYRTYYRANSPRRLRRLAAESAFFIRELSYVGSSPQLSGVPVLGAVEPLWIRMTSRSALAPLRVCLVGVFEKSNDRIG